MAFNDTFRVGAHAIIFNSEGHVLMLKRTYGNKGWSLPGGSVDPGETIHSTLLHKSLHCSCFFPPYKKRNKVACEIQGIRELLSDKQAVIRLQTKEYYPVKRLAELNCLPPT